MHGVYLLNFKGVKGIFLWSSCSSSADVIHVNEGQQKIPNSKILIFTQNAIDFIMGKIMHYVKKKANIIFFTFAVN